MGRIKMRCYKRSSATINIPTISHRRFLFSFLSIAELGPSISTYCIFRVVRLFVSSRFTQQQSSNRLPFLVSRLSRILHALVLTSHIHSPAALSRSFHAPYLLISPPCYLISYFVPRCPYSLTPDFRLFRVFS